jgi:hypothetical protein
MADTGKTPEERRKEIIEKAKKKAKKYETRVNPIFDFELYCSFAAMESLHHKALHLEFSILKIH